MMRVIRSLASTSTGMRETNSAVDLKGTLGSFVALMAAPLWSVSRHRRKTGRN